MTQSWSRPEILIEGDGPVRRVTINRPEQFNAVNEGLHDALADVWLPLKRDPDVRAVVLTGAGKAFCAGGDMAYLERVANDADFRYRTMDGARRIVSEMVAFHKPIVAAVNGPAVGLGCSLAVLCDIVLMSDRAFFSDPHVSLGVVAADGGVLAWPLMMTMLRAKEYLLTGDRIDPPTAERIGLANRVVPGDELLGAAHDLAERLAAQPAQALWDTKRALNLHVQRTIATVVDFAFAAESETFARPDFRQVLAQYQQSVGLASAADSTSPA